MSKKTSNKSSKAGDTGHEVMSPKVGDTENQAAQVEKWLAPMVRALFADLAADLTAQLKATMRSVAEATAADLIKPVMDRVVKLEHQNAVLSTSMDQLQNQLFSQDVIIYGMPTSSSSTIADDVINFCDSALHVSLNKSDISNAYPMGSKSGDSTKRFLVRFSNQWARNRVLRARKELKGSLSGQRCYVNEHLTSANAQIFAEARKLLRAKMIHSTWTRDGLVFLKRTDDPSSQPMRIATLPNLEPFRLPGPVA
jgi:hypothetical protein